MNIYLTFNKNILGSGAVKHIVKIALIIIMIINKILVKIAIRDDLVDQSLASLINKKIN